MKTIPEPNPITPTIVADMKEIDRARQRDDYASAVEATLLPCAHCGGEAIVSRNKDGNDSVQCDNCGVRTAAFENVTDAANRWNERSVSDGVRLGRAMEFVKPDPPETTDYITDSEGDTHHIAREPAPKKGRPPVHPGLEPPRRDSSGKCLYCHDIDCGVGDFGCVGSRKASEEWSRKWEAYKKDELAWLQQAVSPTASVHIAMQ